MLTQWTASSKSKDERWCEKKRYSRRGADGRPDPSDTDGFVMHCTPAAPRVVALTTSVSINYCPHSAQVNRLILMPALLTAAVAPRKRCFELWCIRPSPVSMPRSLQTPISRLGKPRRSRQFLNTPRPPCPHPLTRCGNGWRTYCGVLATEISYSCVQGSRLLRLAYIRVMRFADGRTKLVEKRARCQSR